MIRGSAFKIIHIFPWITLLVFSKTIILDYIWNWKVHMHFIYTKLPRKILNYWNLRLLSRKKVHHFNKKIQKLPRYLNPSNKFQITLSEIIFWEWRVINHMPSPRDIVFG